MQRHKSYPIVMVIILALLLSGCTGGGQVMDGDGMVQTFEYTQITQEEAKQMMEADGTQIIVDVRTKEEYDDGHIPGAICIPNEDIGTEQPAELPALDQIILVYCRSGRRSKEAAQKLADMGYSNLYEFGGIIDWTGDIVKTEESNSEYEAMKPIPIMVLTVGDIFFTVDLEDNSSAEAFVEKLSSDPITVDMQDYGNFEKAGDLPWDLPRNDEKITTQPGDLILYNGNKITVYYDENTWDFTKLGTLNASEEEIRKVFGGEDDIQVKFFVEWTE